MNASGKCAGFSILVAVVPLIVSTNLLPAQEKPARVPAVSQMPRLNTVDSRFVSYNIEMVEVTGGRFWKPYRSEALGMDTSDKSSATSSSTPGVGNTGLYQYRPPIDLSSRKLRNLAAALGPSFVRVSGTWQNSTFFQDDDKPALQQPPEGFKGVLTRSEWKGVIDFARAADANLVTSFPISKGMRDDRGQWSPARAKAFVDYTRNIGGSIAMTEFMNEPSFPGPGGAPANYDAESFARDAKVFKTFLSKESPNTVFLGPGSVGEGVPLVGPGVKLKILGSDDIMNVTGPIFDAFSYHFYGTVSKRCLGNMSFEKALDDEWLDRTDVAEKFYAQLRDKHLPGKPIWLTETAEAACGGDAFAKDFVDTFRFLNQLGTLAQKGVQAVMHNTLASSDYGFLDEDTLEPRPDYWAALLWKRTMGHVVLNPGVAKESSLKVFAHCSVEGNGAVSLLILNLGAHQTREVSLPMAAKALTLTAKDLSGSSVILNGAELHPDADGTVRTFTNTEVKKGSFTLAPLSITFLTFPSANNPACR